MNPGKDIQEEKLLGQLQRLLTFIEASGIGFDQQLLRDLRTDQPAMEPEPASV